VLDELDLLQRFASEIPDWQAPLVQVLAVSWTASRRSSPSITSAKLPVYRSGQPTRCGPRFIAPEDAFAS
jgi:hypothetical protein